MSLMFTTTTFNSYKSPRRLVLVVDFGSADAKTFDNQRLSTTSDGLNVYPNAWSFHVYKQCDWN